MCNRARNKVGLAIATLAIGLSSVLAASGLDGGIKIQSGPNANTNHVTSVTITLETNVNTGSIVVSNVTAGAMMKVDANKKSAPAVPNVDYLPGGGSATLFPNYSTLTYASSITLNLATNDARKLTLTGNTTLSTTGIASNVLQKIRIIGDSTDRTVIVPSSWHMMSGAVTNTAPANKWSTLIVDTGDGTTDSSITASWVNE